MSNLEESGWKPEFCHLLLQLALNESFQLPPSPPSWQQSVIVLKYDAVTGSQ